MAKNKNSDALVEMLAFPCHEAGIRVERGLSVMMEIDRLVEVRDEAEQKVQLFKILSREDDE